MPLRCLLFSPDEETLRTIGQVLTELEIEAESCFKAVEAIEKVTARPFQIVIIDWSCQPEAGLLLNTARERRPPDRPLTLAIVSDDSSVPTALQAGANSVLRKPLLVNQVKDTLATARDLLRSKLEGPGQASAAAAAASSAAAAMLPTEVQSTLRAGEFLQPSGSIPGAQFDTESTDVQKSLEQVAASEIDPLQDLEPMAGGPASRATSPATSYATAAPQARTQPAPAPTPDSVQDDEPHGLAWYLKTRAKSLPPEEQAAQPESPPEKAQLLGYDQTPSFNSDSPAPEENSAVQADVEGSVEPQSDSERPQQREEAALFAYISGEKPESEKEPSQPRPWLKKVAIAAAVIVAGSVAYFTVPPAVMQKGLKTALGPAIRAGHSWLNPQPVTTPQAPQSHESFGRAGDEYKLPVAENIPDANTDPSQIRVVPMIDPTIKQPNNAAAGTDPNAQAATPGSGDPAQTDPNQVAAGQTVAGQVVPGQAPGQGAAGQNPDGESAQSQTPQNSGSQSQVTGTPSQTVIAQPQPAATAPDQPQASTTQAAANVPADPFRSSVSATPIPTPAVQTTQSVPVVQPVRSVSVPVVAHNASTPNLTGIPSSLKSQMAAMSPEASGNKPPEAALPSIEPVNLPEAAARGLLVAQPAPAYPPSARGQAGTVTLQVLIGRDGTVQDAKFLQGSLAFARPAIDAVKQWRFKPYLMNGRPASTQTLLTLSFKPGS
jgi:protein TonB